MRAWRNIFAVWPAVASGRLHERVMQVMMSLSIVSFGVDGNTGRAMFVAALIVSGYVLVRYWGSLREQRGKVRNSLTGLRAASLLLMACALAGLRIEYESRARARVLLQTRGGEDVWAGKVVDALEANNFEVVRAEAETSGEVSNRDSSYAAAILLTNGAASAKDARRVIERADWQAGGAPVYVMMNMRSSEEPSIALESVSVAGRANRGVSLTVRCSVHARGMQGRESLVTISDDAKVQAAARIRWTTNDERQVVTLGIVPKVAGWVNYTAKVEAAGGEDKEMLARPFTLYVEERRLRILFFEGEPTWEAKFIRRALDEAGLFEVDYFAQVSRAAIAGVSASTDEQEGGAEQGGENKRVEAGGAPEARLRAALQSAARLGAYDCVIVGASPDSLLSPAESARLREWVGTRGGGLIVLGGNSFNGSIVAPGGKLYALLPSEISAQSFVSSQSQDVGRGRPLEAEKARSGTALTPTEAGANGALRGFLEANEDVGAKAVALTGHGLRLSSLRPGASVLAVAGQAAADGTSENGAPQIAGMRYGAGHTLIFAPSDSWRIRTGAGEGGDDTGGSFGALWQGLALWTSAGAQPASEIVLSNDSPVKGSVVVAEIRVRDAAFAPLKIQKLGARLQPLTENSEEALADAAQPQAIAFKPDAVDASVWRAQIPVRARGRFILEVDYVAQGRSGSLEKRFSVVAASPFEAGTGFDTLRRLSREHGGDLLDITNPGTLIQRLASIPSSVEPQQRRWELRAWWPLAFILPLLLSLEWLARRWLKVD